MKPVKPELEILFKISASQPKVNSLLLNRSDQFTNIKELTSNRFQNKIRKELLAEKDRLEKSLNKSSMTKSEESGFNLKNPKFELTPEINSMKEPFHPLELDKLKKLNIFYKNIAELQLEDMFTKVFVLKLFSNFLAKNNISELPLDVFLSNLKEFEFLYKLERELYLKTVLSNYDPKIGSYLHDPSGVLRTSEVLQKLVAVFNYQFEYYFYPKWSNGRGDIILKDIKSNNYYLGEFKTVSLPFKHQIKLVEKLKEHYKDYINTHFFIDCNNNTKSDFSQLLSNSKLHVLHKVLLINVEEMLLNSTQEEYISHLQDIEFNNMYFKLLNLKSQIKEYRISHKFNVKVKSIEIITRIFLKESNLSKYTNKIDLVNLNYYLNSMYPFDWVTQCQVESDFFFLLKTVYMRLTNLTLLVIFNIALKLYS